MDTRRDYFLTHFQLRNVLACPSRTEAFYPTQYGIQCYNVMARTTKSAIRTTQKSSLTTLAAGYGVLIGGTLNGGYLLKPLDMSSSVNHTEGTITRDPNGLTCHMELCMPKSSGPQVAIASNDSYFRIMDLQTEKFVGVSKQKHAINCTALGPHRRMRAMVGDWRGVDIYDGETGKKVQELKGRETDNGFACAWSEDGWTLATASEDRGVRIWDARKWVDSNGKGNPLCILRSELATARSLHFSPLGSGKPVLVACEEADYINIIDAQMFSDNQRLDVIGELGGASFTNEGQDLNVLVCDPHRGGILQLERTALEAEPAVCRLSRLRPDREENMWYPTQGKTKGLRRNWDFREPLGIF